MNLIPISDFADIKLKMDQIPFCKSWILKLQKNMENTLRNRHRQGFPEQDSNSTWNSKPLYNKGNSWDSPENRRKPFARYVSDKESISRLYKELKKNNNLNNI